MVGSTLVSAVMIKQIFLLRELNQKQRQLVENQAFAATAQEYGNAWQTLAMHIYQSSRQDPAFAAILKEADVDVRTTPPPKGLTNGTNTPTSVMPTNVLAPTPMPAPKTPVTP
jgi:hypothetical protein